MNSYQQLPPQERMVIMAKIYHHIWYSEGRYFDMLNKKRFTILKQTEPTKSITRNFIQSIIKDHYEMIGKLEKLLDQFPVVERIARHKRRPAEEIILAVNEVFNTDCTEHSRRQRVADARHCAVYMLRQYTDLTLKEIGEQLGSNGHHTTILHSIKTCKNLIDIDEHFAEKYSQTKILLDSKLQLI